MSNGTSNRPDLSDPMGAPKIITGPEYMDSLARLGYNINDPAGLSNMFDIAQKGTNLLDTVYKQNMAVQAASAELGLKVAQTGYYDSETDYNKASMDARIKDLASQATLRNAQALDFGSQAKQRDAQAKEYTKTSSAHDAAMDDLNPLMTDLDDLYKNHLHDPDFETQLQTIRNNHRAVMLDPTGGAQQMADRKVGEIRAARGGIAGADVQTEQRSKIDGLLGQGYLLNYPGGSAGIEADVRAGKGFSILAQGNTAAAIDRLQTVQRRAREMNRPDLVSQAADEIRQLQIGQNPQLAATGGENIQGMVAPPMTKPNGDLNENTEGLIRGMERDTGLPIGGSAAAAAAAAVATGPGPKTKTVTTWERDPNDPTGKTIRPKSVTQTTEGEAAGAVGTDAQQPASGVPATAQAQAQHSEAIRSDPVFQQVLQYARAGQFTIRGGPEALNSTNQAQRQAAEDDVMSAYRQAKQTLGQTVPGQTPPQTQTQQSQTQQAGENPPPFMTPQTQTAQTAGMTRQEAEAEADRRLGPERAASAAEATRKAAAGRKVPTVQDQALQERERIIQGLVKPAPTPRLGAPRRPGGGASAAPAAGGEEAIAAAGQAPAQVTEAALPPRNPARPEQTIAPQNANQVQVQNASAPVLVVNDPAKVDYHTFKFGNATTFGLNYDGTRDFGDNGVGFYNNPVTGRPYNTRDPNLIGASVPASDLVASFGQEATNPNSALSRMIGRGDIQVQVAQPNGGVVQMPLVDQGPGARENATLDLTHGASRLFLTQGKRVLGYRFVDRYGNPFTQGGGQNLAMANTGAPVQRFQEGGLVADAQAAASPTSDAADVGLPLLMASAENQVPIPQNQVAGPLPSARSPVLQPQPIARQQPATQPTAATETAAPRAELVSAPTSTPAPAVTTGPARYAMRSGELSGLATNFGHDVNGNPDTYMLKTLGPGSRIGAFGTDVVNPNTAGVSLPLNTVKQYIGNPSNPEVRKAIQSGRYKVRLQAPNGNSGLFNIVDLGPGPNEPGAIDVTGSAMRQLGVKDNFHASYQIVDTSEQAYATGGFVSAGAKGPDKVPAMLSSGEYVMSKEAVKRIGLANLERMNRGA
jgi:hypothetical protein